MRDKMVVDMEKKGINPKVGAQNIFFVLPCHIFLIILHRGAFFYLLAGTEQLAYSLAPSNPIGIHRCVIVPLLQQNSYSIYLATINISGQYGIHCCCILLHLHPLDRSSLLLPSPTAPPTRG